MNFNLKKFILFYICINLSLTTQATTQIPKKLTKQPATKKNISTKPLPQKSTPCSKPAEIPYAKEFKNSNLPIDQKKGYIAAWGNIYAGYLARNASTAQNSSEWQALKKQVFINNPFCEYTPLGQDPQQIQHLDLCLDTPPKESHLPACQTNIVNAYQALTINYLAEMKSYLASSDFPKFKSDLKDVEYNYATTHLVKALDRLSKTCSISIEKEEPVTKFSGDIRDLGIIVNITNNSNRSFYITDEYSDKTPIAHIEHGLNGVNLYTAALYQDPKEEKNNSLPPCFSFFEIAPATMEPMSNEPFFTIGIYSGAQLVNFLKMLPRKDPKIFDMNGCPTSEEYLANPQDQYMVLIQDPTPRTATVRNLDQRIQAVNLSALTGPYLLTMQINETTDSEINPVTKQPNNSKILQPALTTAQVIQKPTQKTTTTATSMQKRVSTAANSTTSSESNPTAQQSVSSTLDKSLLPLIILPEYLWNVPNIQLFWMLYSTSYVAALTDFSCFAAGNFGNAFEYFNNLGYFNTKSFYRFIIDRYNILKTGETLFDASWLMECGLYETNLNNSSDIPEIYSAYNSQNQIVANSESESNVNFSLTFHPQSYQKLSSAYLKENGFNRTYNSPYLQLYTLIFSLPSVIIKNAAFFQIVKQKTNLFKISWTDKKNRLLNSQTIALDNDKYNLTINSLNNQNSTSEIIIHNFSTTSFTNIEEQTVVYTKKNNAQLFQVTTTSPIDKLEAIQNSFFSKYPITNLYLETYETYQVAPYTTCSIWQNNNLPSFLQNLTEQDWTNGIYVVPTAKNNTVFNLSDPGFLTLVFYKSDKKILGTINTTKNITHPIKGYNINSKEFSPILDVYFSTGILLKYNPHYQ